MSNDERKFGISANGSVCAGSSRRQSGFMSVQSNSGSGGGSLEATPSWSQLSSSPTISQQHITATAKSKEGILARQVHDRLLFSLNWVLRRRNVLLWPCRAYVCWSKNGWQVHWCRELEAKRQLSIQLMASLSSSKLSCLHKGSASLLFCLYWLSAYLMSSYSKLLMR